MRGRTLNDSFVILDEAQNTTPEQMKMFLTRLGYGSKAVITGDVTQIDLPSGKPSGLKHAAQILRASTASASASSTSATSSATAWCAISSPPTTGRRARPKTRSELRAAALAHSATPNFSRRRAQQKLLRRVSLRV
jgi:hypothetical protein